MTGPTAETAQSLAAVLDAKHKNKGALSKHFLSLGGGWHTGFEAWRASGLRFALLIAPNLDRIHRRAPLLLAARDEEALRAIMRAGCAMLDDVTCAWLRAIEPDVAWLVDEELLRDATVMGSA
jgi:hypothetical protein